MARATCPQCGNTNTWAHYEHPNCPKSSLSVYTWKKEAEIGPDGRPVSHPCPGCNDGFPHPPSYLRCDDCGNQW